MSLLEPDAPATTATAGAGWSNPTHRAGWILQAKVSPMAGLPPYDPDPKWTEATLGAEPPDAHGGASLWPEPKKGELLLGVIRAKRAAQIVMGHHVQYNRYVEDVIAAEGKFTVKILDEQPAVRFDPGLIVDLPSFAIKQGAETVATGRLCLTICMHESRSKIWTRISSVKDAAWGSTPCEQLQTLVGASRRWFAIYARSIMIQYAEDISAALLATGEERETDVSLEVRNQIEMISGDTTLTGLGTLSAAVANDDDIDRDPRSREAAARLDQFARCAPGLGLEHDGAAGILRASPTTVGGTPYFFVPHRTARGFRGIYAVRAEGNRLVFGGIASTDPDPYVRVRRLGGPIRSAVNSPSQHVTAELANTVAKYF